MSFLLLHNTNYYLQVGGVEGSIKDVYYVPNLKSNILSMG